MKLTDEDIEKRSHDFSNNYDKYSDENPKGYNGYLYGSKHTRDLYESMFDSELAIMLSRHVHDRCSDNVPHDIGLTLLEVIKNYRKVE